MMIDRDTRIIKLRKMVINLSTLLDKYQIPYWADLGTLLGIVRNKDIIPYDDDADFGYFHEDRNRLLLTLVENLRHFGGHGGYHIHLITGGRIRIFHGYNLPNEPYVDFYKWFGDKPEIGLLEKLTPSRKDIGNLTKITCWEKEISVPEYYERRLEKLYGNWRVPVNKVPYWA